MGQRMQETLYDTADSEDTLLDRRCRRYSMGQQMQETLYETSKGQVMQEILYQTGDAGDTL